jgi:hypothetical protein
MKRKYPPRKEKRLGSDSPIRVSDGRRDWIDDARQPHVVASASSGGLGFWGRLMASVLIAGYLGLLLIGPLSNPVASEHLTAPAARWVAPLHRALFMGHGYRFFAPNPGDSHLVQYKITKVNGTLVEGVFPDRDSMFPRLLYHRWFMLSETIFSEHAQTPTAAEFEKLDEEKKRSVKQLAISGKLKQSNRLESRRLYEADIYAKTIKRIDALVKSIAGYLLEKHGGQQIELSVATRAIPFPAEVRRGAKLDDPQFLRLPDSPVIGRFSAADFSSQRAADFSSQQGQAQ